MNPKTELLWGLWVKAPSKRGNLRLALSEFPMSAPSHAGAESGNLSVATGPVPPLSVLSRRRRRDGLGFRV